MLLIRQSISLFYYQQHLLLLPPFVGLIIGLLQTITQIQEQTLPFGIKLVCVFVCLLMTMGWMGEKLLVYAKEMLAIGFAG